MADRPAREKQRSHDERVGGEGEPNSAKLENGGVGLGARLAAKRRNEEMINELRRHLPAATVAHHDVRAVSQREWTRPSLEGETRTSVDRAGFDRPDVDQLRHPPPPWRPRSSSPDRAG